MTKALISARRRSESPEKYAWVWVVPLRDGRFRVAAFEIAKQTVDDDDCFFEDDLDRTYLKIVDSVDDVDDAVWAAGADPAELAAPWHNDFPL